MEQQESKKSHVDYTPAFKLQVVADARRTNISKAHEKHNVDRKSIRRWMANEARIKLQLANGKSLHLT